LCASGAGRILKAYEAYDFHEVVQRLMRFCSVEMGRSTRHIKDRHTAKADAARRSCQTALFHIAEALVRGWRRSCPSPPMKSGATCRAIVRSTSLPGEWYEGLFGLGETEAMNDAFWDELLKVRGEVNKVIEQACG
jgi:isoleucyl-tRNA synthetase